jgi:Tol biopolymer transport system component
LFINEFAVSPTGDFIVYAAGPANGGSDLYLLDLNGSSPQMLLDCHGEVCRYPAISQDGTQIAYQRAELAQSAGGITTPKNARVWILNVATRQNTAVSEVDHDAHTPAWGPQGWLAYYDQTLAMTVVDDLRGKRTDIPNSSGSVGAWSPDGKYLTFPEIQLTQGSAQPAPASTPSAGTTPASAFYSHLIRVTVATNQIEDLSKSPVVEDTSPALSQDGEQIAFARKYLDPLHWTPGRQLWIMEADGADPKQFTYAPDYNISSILWSPDSSTLLFVRFDETDPSQPPEIWTIQSNGRNPRRLIVGGYLPQWLP